MRKVIDLLQNGEKVYIRNHAQSTYMSNGVSIEDTINRLQVGNVDLINYYTKQEIDDKKYVSLSQLSQVATSGSYNDLTDKPVMKTVNGESILGEGDISSGFIKGEGEGSVILKDSENSSATGKNSIAGGMLANANGGYSVALGRGCEAGGGAAVALGGIVEVLQVTGKMGALTYTAHTYINEYFVGCDILAPDGIFATKLATIQSVFGNQFTVDTTLSADADLNKVSFAVRGCRAVASSSVALCQSFMSSNTGSYAEGRTTIASGKYSHAEGTNTMAIGNYSHSEGNLTKAKNTGAHAEGYGTIASGTYSHAEGVNILNIYFTGENKIYTISDGTNFQNSFSFIKELENKSIVDAGSGTILATVTSVIMADDGYTITVTLDTDLGILEKARYGVLIGGAYGAYSHSENASLAKGVESHSQGYSVASGNYSFSHGNYSVAEGKISTAFGTNNYAQNNSEFALGISNHSHTGDSSAEQTLFSVGCGDWQEMGMDVRIANQIPLPTPEDGKNAIEIMRNGDIWLGNYGDGVKLYDKETNKLNLADVATTGSYNDLTDKPTIPAQVTESVVNGWGFTKNSGTYSKPSGGIPKTDLDNSVQTSLGKADTALQSYTEQYKGTITGVSANGTSVSTSGVANIPAASTSAYGVTKLSSSTSSTSTSLAATASAVKSAYDLANGKQDKLTSGTNIKTINGQSILGSGNITISGGSSSSGGNGAYAEVSHGTSDTTFTLTPNTFHLWDEVSSLTLTLGEETAGVANEYLFQFTSGSEPTVLTLPDSIVWANYEIPVIKSNHIYQVSVLKGLASIMSFEKATLMEFSINIWGAFGENNTVETYSYMSGMTWGEWCQSEYNTNGYYEVSGDIIFYNNPNVMTMDGYVSYSTGYSTEYCTVDEVIGIRDMYQVE